MAETSSSPEFDVIVVGAGLAGLAAALGFSRAGFRVALVGPPERASPGRTVALFGRTLDFFENLGALAAIEAEGAAMRILRLVDDTGSLFAARPVEFRASELGRDVFGWNIENGLLAGLLERALGQAAMVTTPPRHSRESGNPGGAHVVPVQGFRVAKPLGPRVRGDDVDGRNSNTPPGDFSRFEGQVVGFDFGAQVARLTLADGAILTGKLVVGADGRGSPSRKAAGVETSVRRFDQTALTLRLRHTRPHEDASTEFHTREGPFTLVPLPPTPKAAHRSSLVWLMREASAERRKAMGDVELAEEIRRHARAMLGDMEIEGARGSFPMTIQRVAALTARRLALVGDAAHAFPPIGAQGLNLGLRDVAGIVEAATRARAEGADIGGEATLAAYAAARRPDIATRTLGVGLLNASLLAPLLPVDAARGLGLGALGALAPLRKLAMREGLNPFLAR